MTCYVLFIDGTLRLVYLHCRTCTIPRGTRLEHVKVCPVSDLAHIYEVLDAGNSDGVHDSNYQTETETSRGTWLQVGYWILGVRDMGLHAGMW